MGDINQLVRLLHLPPDLLRGGENLSKASSATRSTEQPKAAAAEEAAANNILTLTKTARTQKKQSYTVSHLYYSLDGKEHAGAKKFLDRLIWWNSRSDNDRLGDTECPDGCSSLQKGVKNMNETVDTPGDLNNVKRMSNVSVTYADSANDKDNGKFNVRIWSPGSGSGSETYASVVDYCDIKNEAPEREVMVSLLKRMYERYVKLKGIQKLNSKNIQPWKGWYYLSRFALEKRGSVKLYKIVDSVTGEDNRIAYVPLMQHAPELTFLHKSTYGTIMNITDFKDFEKYTDIEKVPWGEYVNKTEEERKKLQNESFMVDVILADEIIADGDKFNCILDGPNVAEIYGCEPKE